MTAETHSQLANFIWGICDDQEFQNSALPILARAIFETIRGKEEELLKRTP
jgi:hypothetical protein